MTVQGLYEQALSLLPTSVDEDNSLQQYMVGWVNLALSETLEIQNSILVFNDDDPLDEAPKVTNLESVIPYDPKLTDNAFVYFIASLASKDDDNDYWAQDYRARYISAVNEASKHIPTVITDYYMGGDD